MRRSFNAMRHVSLATDLFAALAFGSLLFGSACGAEDRAAPRLSAEVQKTADDEAETAQLPDAELILAKHVEAIGGREAIAKIRTLYTKSEVRVEARKVVGVSEMWWQRGEADELGRFALQQSLEGIGRNSAGYDGERLWTRDPFNSLRTLEGKEAELYQRGSSPFLIADWKKHFVAAKTLARVEGDQGAALEVELLTPLDQRVVMVFSENSSLLVEVRFDQVTPDGPQPLITRSSDYREVAGLRFAHTQHTRSEGEELIQHTLDIQVGVAIDPVRFADPLGGQRVQVDPARQSFP